MTRAVVALSSIAATSLSLFLVSFWFEGFCVSLVAGRKSQCWAFNVLFEDGGFRLLGRSEVE